ncbi:TPA: SufS family cysteine desulfurase [Candidatus Woesearchaeota archaeon]|jgi:cysteine desulfurase/selenocysteine lyase|nr:cysteine desulfurase [archaeon]HIJ11091.1 SufS family cysteine desulfurase [Candidatus Woesearchaeota archaeon]
MKTTIPILSKAIYLDNAATTQKPQVVIDAMKEYYENYNANVHRGIYTLAEKATVAYEKSRDIVATFIGASREEVVFTSGTTESINVIARMLEPTLKEGDEIVITVLEHHSNMVPWQQSCKRTGAVLKVIQLNKDNEVDIEDAKNKITNKTKIVAFSGYSNVLGDVIDVTALLKLAKAVEAYTVIDGAQLVPHKKVDVKKIDCDFFAFSGHKMCGPTGIGVLYGKKKLLEELEPVLFGGEMIATVSQQDATWADLPHKFEAGTPKICQAIGLGVACDYLSSIQYDKKEQMLIALAEYAKMELAKRGVTLIKTKGSIITFTLDNIHPHDIAEVLNKYTICVRAGNHCTMPLHDVLGVKASVRISLYHYNSQDDIDRLLEGVAKAQEVFDGS